MTQFFPSTGLHRLWAVPANHRRPRRRLNLECLEERSLLSTGYVQTNLVSDMSGVAQTTDPNLVNPWGIALSPGDPFWISNNGSGNSTLYDGNGVAQSLVVTIPAPTAGATSAPTGVVFNSGNNFDVSAGGKTGASSFTSQPRTAPSSAGVRR
jgi:hypothetical protein